MSNTLISVIIPTYNGLEQLGEAIQSVLCQTYPYFEVIVVDDASPENSADQVNQFSDPRVKFFRHEKNRGAVAARKTGVLASSGEIIAFLDQDDLFHEEKLYTHLQFLQKHPDVGATYNARFEVRDSVKNVFGLWQPPKYLTLTDFVLGFPIAPSDIVLRRGWALQEEIWDDSFASQAEHVIFNGQEIVFCGRLALAGCQFGNVGRALNYRRFHSKRKQKHLVARCKSELTCQEIIFKDQRCPQDVLAIRITAASNIYLTWAFVAYLQEDFYIGQEFLRKAVELKPSLLEGEPCDLINSWIAWIAMDNAEFGFGNDAIIKSTFNNFPEEYRKLNGKYDWAIAKSYLYRGIHCMIWGSQDSAHDFLIQAKVMRAIIDDQAVRVFTQKLLDYEEEFGAEAGLEVMNNLAVTFNRIGYKRGSRIIQSTYWTARAFKDYQSGIYHRVRSNVFRGMLKDLSLLKNLGVLSIFGKSFFKG